MVPFLLYPSSTCIIIYLTLFLNWLIHLFLQWNVFFKEKQYMVASSEMEAWLAEPLVGVVSLCEPRETLLLFAWMGDCKKEWSVIWTFPTARISKSSSRKVEKGCTLQRVLHFAKAVSLVCWCISGIQGIGKCDWGGGQGFMVRVYFWPQARPERVKLTHSRPVTDLFPSA